MTETYRVVAAKTGGMVSLVGGNDRYVTHKSLIGLTYDQAATAWTRLDDARRAGRLPLVEYLVVRSDSDPDPRWYGAKHDLVPFVVGRQRGWASIRDAARAWGLANGYKGAKGGWIYRAADLERERTSDRFRARAYGQGWDTLIMGGVRHQRVVTYDRRYYWNDLETLYAPSGDAVLV